MTNAFAFDQRDPAQWGRGDTLEEARGKFRHATRQLGVDGPGRRRRPIDQLRTDGVISAEGHAGAERLLSLIAHLAPMVTASQSDFAPSQPHSRCLTNDYRLDARDSLANASQAVRDAVGRMGWRMLTDTLDGATLASLALARGYVRGVGAGDARRLHSQVYDAYEALGAYFVAEDKAKR